MCSLANCFQFSKKPLITDIAKDSLYEPNVSYVCKWDALDHRPKKDNPNTAELFSFRPSSKVKFLSKCTQLDEHITRFLLVMAHGKGFGVN